MSERICGDAITDRNDEHRVSVCVLLEGHKCAHVASDCVWTDGEHWGEPDLDNPLERKEYA
jgi:hypothetical protein